MVYETYVSPNSIRFTQDSIAESFTDQEETIENTFEDLLHGDITVDFMPRIVVVEWNGDFWVISGNRRLYIYQKLEEYDFLEEIPVIVKPMIWERFSRKLTTENDGESVFIRQDKRRRRGDKMEDRLRNIYNEWVNRDEPSEDEYNHGGPIRYEIYVPPVAVHNPPSRNISSVAQTQPKPSSQLDNVVIHNPPSRNISSPSQTQPKPSSQLDNVVTRNPPSSKISPLPSSPSQMQPQTSSQLAPRPPTIRLEIPPSTSATKKKKRSCCTIL